MSVLGWTMAHSVWQAALLAAVLAVALRILPERHALARGRLATAGLALVVGCAIVTWLSLSTEMARHDACWESSRYRAAHPGACASHGVPRSNEGTAAAGAGDTGMKLEEREAVTTWNWRSGMPPSLDRHAANVALEATPAMPWILLLAGSLMTIALIRLVAGLLALRRVVARSRPCSREGSVEVRLSNDLVTPAVAGWRRTVVLIPDGAKRSLGDRRFACVLAHETAHVRRADYARNLCQRLVECLLAWNPAALWISRRIREEREAAVDDLATQDPRVDRRTYVETLLALELRRRSCGRPACVGFRGEGSLLRRVRRLADDRDARPSRRALVAAAALSVAAVAMLAQGSVAALSASSWAVMRWDIDVRESMLYNGNVAAPEFFSES